MSAAPPLLPFQENAVRRFLERGALLVAHEAGMGKTRTALEALRRLAADRPDFRALVVAPANLRGNFLENARRYAPTLGAGIVLAVADLDRRPVSVVSYDFLRANADALRSRRFDAVVCDEIHHGKNRAAGNHACLAQLRTATDRFLCLTGSPLQNSLDQFWALLDLTAGRELTGELDACLSRAWDLRRASFLKRLYCRFIGKRPLVGPPTGVARPAALRRLAGEWVDLIDAASAVAFGERPGLAERIVRVRLTDYEWNAYRYAMRKTDGECVAAAPDGALPDRELKNILSALSAARQTLLSPDAIRENISDPAPSGKLAAVAAGVAGQSLPALAFSNFLAFGAKPLHKLLTGLGVECGLLHGGVPRRKREEALAKFRAGRLDALVLAPVGGEGLDLPGGGSVHLADPHWNPEATRQMIGRARRLGSGRRELPVFHYRAAGPNGEPTLDDVIAAVALRKDRVNRAVRDIVTGRIMQDEPLLFR
ncbi:MAG: DEAD/DEAH box helicase [Planctomycetota bacterium]|jgi:SNF2 family DNA or RNA helicase|nr:DEAD/DEAH box helicase [Planctomycetota bacterium]